MFYFLSPSVVSCYHGLMVLVS